MKSCKNERNTNLCNCLFSLTIHCGNFQLFTDCLPQMLQLFISTRNGGEHYFCYPPRAMLITALGDVLPVWVAVTHHQYLNFTCWLLVKLSTLPSLAGHPGLFFCAHGPHWPVSPTLHLWASAPVIIVWKVLNRGGEWSDLQL